MLITLNHLALRVIFSALTAFLVGILISPSLIQYLRGIQKKGHPIRAEGMETHLQKRGTPTMGGLLILFPWLLSVGIWAPLASPYVYLPIFVTCTLGFLGGMDDYLKLKYHSSNGLSPTWKVVGQTVVGIISGILLEQISPFAGLIQIPYCPTWALSVGSIIMVGWATWIIICTSNAVNFTDGLDGLVTFPIIVTLIAFSFVACLSSFGALLWPTGINTVLSIPGSQELIVVSAAFIGASLSFLWFNAHPAQIFMGDVGSFAAGGLIAMIALLLKQELLILIVGGLFVIETLSVVIQVFYYKRTKRRIFLMAPIHHHFEKKGWPETVVVMRFWIVSFLLAGLGMLGLLL